jgi:hypothetical protein
MAEDEKLDLYALALNLYVPTSSVKKYSYKLSSSMSEVYEGEYTSVNCPISHRSTRS